MLSKYWNSDRPSIVLIFSLIAILDIIFSFGMIIKSHNACLHAKSFSKHEVRWDSFGYYLKEDDGHWIVLDNPAKYLE